MISFLIGLELKRKQWSNLITGGPTLATSSNLEEQKNSGLKSLVTYTSIRPLARGWEFVPGSEIPGDGLANAAHILTNRGI